MARTKTNSAANSSADLGFEAKLWLAADKLRSNMDAAEYKHVVLGLIFLKYISDAFEEHHAKLVQGSARDWHAEIGDPPISSSDDDYAGADPEDPDEYKALNVFWVPPGARWTYLQNSAKQATIGKIVDDAMVAIERDNPRPKGVLPKDYSRPGLDKHRLGELIDLIGTISFLPGSAGACWNRRPRRIIFSRPSSLERHPRPDIRRALIEADLVDCMVALPGQLFYSTQIPVCLWFLSKSKAARVIKGLDNSAPVSLRERRRETLFIDARKMGKLIDRVHRELTDDDLAKIVSTYHAWRGNSSTIHDSPITNHASAYADIPGFCKSATTAEITAHGHVLTPGRYVGAEEVEDDGEPFDEKMPRLVAELEAQFAESDKLESAIRLNLTQFDFKP